MRLHRSSRGPRRLALGMTLTAALAMTLVACSGAGSPTAKSVKHHTTGPSATAPAANQTAQAAAAAAWVVRRWKRRETATTSER